MDLLPFCFVLHNFGAVLLRSATVWVSFCNVMHQFGAVLKRRGRSTRRRVDPPAKSDGAPSEGSSSSHEVERPGASETLHLVRG